MTLQNCITSSNGPTPNFVSPYVNSNHTAIVYDEGGHNSISLRYDQIGVYTSAGTPQGDYHLQGALPVGANIRPLMQKENLPCPRTLPCPPASASSRFVSYSLQQ